VYSETTDILGKGAYNLGGNSEGKRTLKDSEIDGRIILNRTLNELDGRGSRLIRTADELL
jgi:hypothetical protein